MLTYLAMNLMFPGPFFIYAIGFGWVFWIFLLPVDIILGLIISLILNGVKEPWNQAKNRTAIGIFSVSLNFAFVGVILAIIVIVDCIRNWQDISLDYETKHHSLIGLGFSILSVLMTVVFLVIMFVSCSGMSG